jgi:hypothetical protein
MVIGVNELFARDKLLDWLHEHEPVAMIGYSIWVFEINDSNKLDLNSEEP